MNPSYKHYHRIAWIAVLLALAVIVFGGFVRLSNAGLSCPDWPTCYGQVTWPVHDHEVDAANAAFERPVESHKAWREQVHRHLAATLGVLVLVLALLAARKRPGGLGSLLGASALVALSIPAYTGVEGVFASNHAVSLALVVAGELILLTLSLLAWLAWKPTPDTVLVQADAARLRRLLWVGLGLLVVQIALGGWTSANYAALSCGTHYPQCLGQWWPHADWREAFVLWRGIGVDYEGGVLDGPARVAIQLSHRLVAVLVFGHLLMVGIRMFRTPGLRWWATVLVGLLLAQVTLGILNVKLALPLWTAVSHVAGAALLLFVIVGLLARLRAPE